LYEGGEDGKGGRDGECRDAPKEAPALLGSRALTGTSLTALTAFAAPSFRTQASGPLANPQPERPLSQYPIVLAFTGASGAPYGLRLLDVLARNRIPVWLVVSSHGLRLLHDECGIDSIDGLQKATGGDWSSVVPFPDEDRGAPPASGSQRTGGMVVCPCSMGTVAAIAGGTSRSLVERAADVTLKERRKLILVPRETPLSLVHLRNLVSVTEAGAVVIPAAPGFYHRPTHISELVDFIVQRILDQLGLEIEISRRWSGKA
jgi:4-hydroxy-3-polyprenylbenzoate decarboxylase